MESKTIVIINIILTSIICILWSLGITFVNINLIILAMILLLISTYPYTKYYNEYNKFIKEFINKRKGKIIEDERTEHIEEKSAFSAFWLMTHVSIYGGLIIFTFNFLYPEYINLDLSYPLFIIAFIGLITYIISITYYGMKYSD